MRRHPIRLICLTLMCVGLAACPPKNRRQVGAPKIHLPSNGDAKARARFDASRSQFERDEHLLNVEEFEAIVREYPDDPIVPHALLYGALADLRSDQTEAALAKLDEVKRLAAGGEPMLMARASLFRGITLVRLDRLVDALTDLRSGEPALNRDDSSELAWWHGAMAEGAMLESQPAAAIVHYDAFWRVGTPAEKSYAADRISALSTQIVDSQVSALVDQFNGQSGPGTAYLGRRLMKLVPERAALLASQVAASEQALGIEPLGMSSSGPGNPDVLGALLPLTGRLNRVGELSMRGLILASDRFPGSTEQAGASAFSMVARDTSSTPGGVSAGLQALIAEQAVAVIGPFDGSAVAAAAPLAAGLGISLISLAPRSAQSGELSIRHSAEERARALAAHAFAQGVRDFAVLAPANAYGQVVGKAFAAEVRRLGAQVVVTVEYPADTTSFKEHVNKLKKPWTALFVPDLAKRLELIAPALAAANLNALPLGTRSKRGRSIMLLSTAEGIDQSYLRSSGRYSLGAVIAPGFYSDRTDALIAAFVGSYEAQFGSEPGSHEAYAFDAANVVRHAVDHGALSRAAVSVALRQQKVLGLTGTIEFGADGRRSDKGLLFEVTEPIAEQFELRAMR